MGTANSANSAQKGAISLPPIPQLVENGNLSRLQHFRSPFPVAAKKVFMLACIHHRAVLYATSMNFAARLCVLVALWTVLQVGASMSAADSEAGSAADSEADSAAVAGRLSCPVAAFEFVGPDARHQLVISLIEPQGFVSDVTRKAAFLVEPAGIVSIDPKGYLTPVANGRATVTAQYPGAENLAVEVQVSKIQHPPAISFPNDIVPHLTRAGCNGGSCHGTPKGQNNFRLSLLGFEPKTDYEFLTRESRGRRVFPAAPGNSLLLQKASGDQPHRGGTRIPKNSTAYHLLHRWIADGLPYGRDDEPTVDRIEVIPADRVLQSNAQQQLAVIAHFSDGATRDITRVAGYQANQPDMCEVDDQGLVSAKKLTGTASIMVRFQEKVTTFTATIPLGAPTPNLPTPNNFIDEHVFAKLRTLGLPSSELCDDSTFVRRVALDLAGRLPTLDETTEFLASTSADKRAHYIDQLVGSSGYVDWFTNKWSGILRNKAGGNLEQIARETYGFHAWIRESMRTNQPFDQFARKLITARGKPSSNPAVSWYRAVSDPNERMADMAQVFLGVRIQCAQCHHHPYEKWSQDDYHGFAAFFSTLATKKIRKLPEDDVLYHKRIVAVALNPNTNRELKPTPLDGEPLQIPAHRDPRIELANWMTGQSNPFFAKMLVNRYWKHFFGRGLVEPEDDIRVTNPATHPELLNELAGSFTESGFDLQQLCRAICNTRTYQQSSFPNQYNGSDEQNFARYYPRRMAAEIMLDAINDVADASNSFNRQPVGIRAVALPDDSVNNESFFLRAFGRPQMDTACECERSTSADLSQSLTLLNSDTMHRILQTSNGAAQRFAKDTDRDDGEKIDELYLRALSRLPDQSEIATALAHLKKKHDQSVSDPDSISIGKATQEAYEDILWVVVNTKEFLFNH